MFGMHFAFSESETLLDDWISSRLIRVLSEIQLSEVRETIWVGVLYLVTINCME